VTYPFLFVILISFFIFSLLGMSVFGGSINSSTRAQYLKMVGSELNENYEYLNWNDLVNSFAFVYTIVINNSIPTLLNMCIVDSGLNSDFRGIYFFVFQILVNMTLFNIFIGMVIGISLEYFKTELEKKKNDKSKLYEDSQVSLKIFKIFYQSY